MSEEVAKETVKFATSTKYTDNTELSDDTKVREAKWEKIKKIFLQNNHNEKAMKKWLAEYTEKD